MLLDLIKSMMIRNLMGIIVIEVVDMKQRKLPLTSKERNNQVNTLQVLCLEISSFVDYKWFDTVLYANIKYYFPLYFSICYISINYININKPMQNTQGNFAQISTIFG